jgi:hypothetical protein
MYVSRYVLARRWMRNDPDVDVEHLPGTVSCKLIQQHGWLCSVCCVSVLYAV